MKYSLIENPGNEIAIGVTGEATEATENPGNEIAIGVSGEATEATEATEAIGDSRPGFLQLLAWGVITNDLIGYILYVHGDIDYILLIYPISYICIPFYTIFNLSILLYYRIFLTSRFVNFILTVPYVILQLHTYHSES